MTTTMSGLRVYIKAPGVSVPADIAPALEAVNGDRVFYSRRGNGPVYRWLYEAKLDHWRPRRMNTSDAESHRLSVAAWKTVPDSLQAELCKHYLD